MNQFTVDLSDFKHLNGVDQKVSQLMPVRKCECLQQRDMKHQAFLSDLEAWIDKFQTVNAVIARNQAQHLASIRGDSSPDEQGYQLLGHVNEIDYTQEQLQERKQIFDQAERLIMDISIVSEQLLEYSQQQGQYLQEIDLELGSAVSNTEMGH